MEQTEFEALLEKKNRKMFHRYCVLVEQVRPVLPYLQPHDETHAAEPHILTVLQTIDALVPGAVKKKWPPQHIFLMLASAWLHDIGKLENFRSEIPPKEQLKLHGERSHEFIRDKGREFSLDKEEARVVAWLAKGHTAKVLSDLPESTAIGLSRAIPIRSFAALLRLADEFDLTYRRAPLLVRALSEIDDGFKWRIRGATGGISIEPEQWRITVYSFPESKAVQEEVNSMIDFLNGLLDSLEPDLANIGLYYRKISHVSRIESQGENAAAGQHEPEIAREPRRVPEPSQLVIEAVSDDASGSIAMISTASAPCTNSKVGYLPTVKSEELDLDKDVQHSCASRSVHAAKSKLGSSSDDQATLGCQPVAGPITTEHLRSLRPIQEERIELGSICAIHYLTNDTILSIAEEGSALVQRNKRPIIQDCLAKSVYDGARLLLRFSHDGSENRPGARSGTAPNLSRSGDLVPGSPIALTRSLEPPLIAIGSKTGIQVCRIVVVDGKALAAPYCELAPSNVSALAFKMHRTTLVSGGGSAQSAIRVWDLTSQRETKVLHAAPFLSSLAFSADDSYLLATARDESFVWATNDYRLVRTYKHGSPFVCASLSADRSVVSVTQDNLVHIWALGPSQPRRLDLCATPIRVLALPPTSQPFFMLAAGSEIVDIFSFAGARLAQLSHPSPVTCIAFSPNGGLLTCGTKAGSIHTWAVRSRTSCCAVWR